MPADRDLRGVSMSSARLILKTFSAGDAAEAFACVTPTLTRFMSFDPAPSIEAFAEIWQEWQAKMADGTDLPLVIRLTATGEFLGLCGLHCIGIQEPELGIWIKEASQGRGYGREAIARLIAWAAVELGAAAVIYPVAEENWRSRRVPESLGGTIVGSRTLQKPSGVELSLVVYRIPAAGQA